jgi:UDP-hydrolysing UDP-N-acetyl-D-glucosamine 2-epimerase
MIRTVAVYTSSRADFGLLLPMIRLMSTDPEFDVVVIATGAHFSERHGRTIDEVRAQNLNVRLVEMPVDGGDGTPTGVVAEAGRILIALAPVLAETTPDLLVVLGDRTDALPAPFAGTVMGIPVLHVSGGDVTEGAIDDGVRHAMTKLSHVHAPSIPAYGRRIEQLGEEAWRIHVAGHPGLDGITDEVASDATETLAGLGLDPTAAFTLVTFHPVTVGEDETRRQLAALLSAADAVEVQILFTYPNADAGHRIIVDAIENYAERHPDRCSVARSLGRRGYLGMLAIAGCVVGNSSSGIVEAASFGVPVVNIGERQRGRLAPENVTSVPGDAAAVASAWRAGLAAAAEGRFRNMRNPYAAADGARVLVDAIRVLPPRANLLHKRFVDCDRSTSITNRNEPD